MAYRELVHEFIGNMSPGDKFEVRDIMDYLSKYHQCPTKGEIARYIRSSGFCVTHIARKGPDGPIYIRIDPRVCDCGEPMVDMGKYGWHCNKCHRNYRNEDDHEQDP